MNEHEQKLAALKAELAEIEAKLAEVPALEARKRELRGEWRSKGEIWHAKMAIRDSEFPIWHEGSWRTNRIVAVDEKWIYIREDESEEKATRYRRSDGQKERTRNQWDRIDVEKALRIWEEHQATAQPARG